MAMTGEMLSRIARTSWPMSFSTCAYVASDRFSTTTTGRGGRRAGLDVHPHASSALVSRAGVSRLRQMPLHASAPNVRLRTRTGGVESFDRLSRAGIHAASPVNGQVSLAHFASLVQRAGVRGQHSDTVLVQDRAFSLRYGCCGGGPDFESPNRMIHFNDSPAGEEPHFRPTTGDQPPDELSPERLQAIMRALDEVLAEARSLRARIDGQMGVSLNAARSE
jgi:hypothetical protein